MVVGFNKYSYLPRTMRKVAIRWNLSSLYGSNDISQILDIVEKIEVLGHLSISKEGIIQLAEIKLKDNKNLKDFSNLPNFEIIKKYEEDEDGILVSVLCTHPLVISGIEMSNIHVQTPYGISSENGMEMRISGVSESVRNFVSLLRNVLPPDKISVQSLKGNNVDNWIDNLTSRQKETLSYAAYRGYYDTESKTTLRELAEELGMARSTLGEHIQRAELSIIRKAIEDLGLEKSKLNPNAQSTVADGK
jgi:predicted DNA binding protein